MSCPWNPPAKSWSDLSNNPPFPLELVRVLAVFHPARSGHHAATLPPPQLLPGLQGLRQAQSGQAERTQPPVQAVALRLGPHHSEGQGAEGDRLQGSLQPHLEEHAGGAPVPEDDQERDDGGFVRFQPHGQVLGGVQRRVHPRSEGSLQRYCSADVGVIIFVVVFQGLEQVPVPVINGINNEMLDFCNYATKRVPMEDVPLNTDPEFLIGCDCEDDCAVTLRRPPRRSFSFDFPRTR
jgi:hypothetical protein